MFDDVTKVGGDDLRSVGFVPERGIITGGWPCQDISLAGQRSGLDGERSGLFSEVVRLLTELQPRWFVLENVPNLLSINGGRDMGAVVGALAECGYGLSWRVCDASGFGVPQRRRRIFFVGHFGDGGGCSAQVLFEPEGVCGDSPKGGEAGPQSSCEVAGCTGTRCGGGRDVVGTLQTSQRGCPDTDSVASGQLVVEHVVDISSNTHTHKHTSRRSRVEGNAATG